MSSQGYQHMIPVMKPHLPTVECVSPYLEQMDRSGIYSNFGPLVSQLESRYATFLGVNPNQVVSVANATLGIQGACTIFPPREWIVPAFTFAATLHALLHSNFAPRLCDVSMSTYELDLGGCPISQDTGIVPVMPFGKKPDPGIYETERFTVIDAAASLGASEGSLQGLGANHAAVFSLHATKVLGAGEGGIVVFGDVEYASIFRKWTNFAFNESRISTFPATNAKMSEMHAAYALASLDGWESEQAQWGQALSESRLIGQALGIDSPIDHLEGVRPYWIAQFKSNEDRDLVESALTAADVQTRHWWPQPLNEMPAFFSVSPGETFPCSKELSRVTLGLPMYRDITSDELNIIRDVMEPLLLD